jgi:alkanesulfonate monooxygenase SsuD/methylene tetrahydromethanopterin reductase-like flavin-dependent oxidoreductase (luciferase family)
MILAYIAWDLQAYSRGRFILGLGTQVKGHNERRFSVKWESPGEKLREVILALRAIWDWWQSGTKLDFQGEFYQHTLMTPFFSPGPIEHPQVPIFIAGVNPYVTRLAGELCDGFHVHPFHSARFLREQLIPDIEAGAPRPTDAPRARALDSSVPRHRRHPRRDRRAAREDPPAGLVLRLDPRVPAGARRARLGHSVRTPRPPRGPRQWSKMPREVSDDMLDAYSLSGSPDEIGAKVKDRYTGLLDRISPYFFPVSEKDQQRWRTILRAIRE